MKKFCSNSKKSVAKRGLALALAASVAFSTADMTAMAVADEAEIDPIEIAQFEGLDKDVAYQQLTVGASESDIVFPGTIRAVKSDVNEINIDKDSEVTENPEEAQDQSEEGTSDDSVNVVDPSAELLFEEIEEEEPEDEITVEEDENIVARLLGSFFNNIFNGFSTTALAADTDEINVTVDWILSEELSDRAEFSTDEAWLRYVYVPEIPSVYVTDAELPNITVDVIGGEVLGEVRPEEDEVEIEVEEAELQDTDKTDDSEEAAFEEEDTETTALPEQKTYAYVAKSGDETDLEDVLKATTVDGASAPIISSSEGAPVIEIVKASVKETDSAYLTLTETTPGTGASPSKKYTLKVLQPFAEGKELTVYLKEKTDSSSDSSSSSSSGASDSSSSSSSGSSGTEEGTPYTIMVTADTDQNVTVTVNGRYVYNKKPQKLNGSDVVVTVGTSTTPLVYGTDYEIEYPTNATNAGTYDFVVKFIEGTASAALIRTTGKWTIKPVEVKLTADNKASVVNQDIQRPTYSLTCINSEDSANFKSTDQIPGITVDYASSTVDKTKSGVYDIVNSYTGTDPNFDIKTEQNVNSAKYYVAGAVKLQMVVGGKKYDSGTTIQKGTSYYATFTNLTSSGIRISSLTATYVYKDAAGNIVATVTGTKTDGLPTDLGKYTVYAVYKITKLLLPDKTTVSVTSSNDATTDAINYEIVETKKEITSSNVTLNKTSFTYNGKDQGPTVTVKYEGTKLKEGTDYVLSGNEEETDADTYEVTVTGIGEYSGSVDKTWKINPANLSSATIPSSTKVSYTYTGSEISHSVPSSITLSGMTLKIDEEYELDESNSTVKATKAGTYTVKLKAYDDNFTGTKSYTWKITSSSSTAGTASSAVSFSNPNNVTSGVSNVASSVLSSYASSKKESGKKITFTLNVKPIAKSSLNSTELNAITEYGDEAAVTTDSLDVTVHKKVTDTDGNTLSDEDVSDLGSCIDVIAYIGTANAAKTINVIRDHNGEVKKFSKLSSRPSSSYTDGTYYVDKSNGKVYIYSRYFSRFTLIYTDTDTVVKNTKTTTSKSSSSSDSGDALGARAPQTGDNLPVVWVWVIVLLAGVALIGFSAFELKRFKRGDFKKKR